MAALLALLIVSQAGADLRVAPEVLPWPEVTPASLLTPAEARVYVDGAERADAGLWMPDELAGVINGRLAALSAYPERCQARLDGLERIHAVVLQGAVAAAWADAKALEPQGWRWWEVAMVGIGAAAFGVMVGGGLALAVTR